jgi:hypothetical protein
LVPRAIHVAVGSLADPLNEHETAHASRDAAD